MFFLGPQRKLMAVAVSSTPTFNAGVPQPLFDAQVSGLVDVRAHYAVTGDGSRFLINMLIEDPSASSINVVVNWRPGAP